MEIVVVLRQVPDLVEELEINEAGTDLERDYLKYVLSEFDDWALEQALLLKEQDGGSVTALALDLPEVDHSLYTALAKGADRALKITGDFPPNLSNRAMASLLAEAIRALPHDLILTGVQSVEDLDGQIPALLASVLGYSAVGVVTEVTSDDGALRVQKEFAGGLLAELEIDPPAVLGVQAARQAPRYAPISRVRAVMKEKPIEPITAGEIVDGLISVRAFRKPEGGRRAEMIEGDASAIAEQIVTLLQERGLARR